jgi:hypothetical protein
MKQLQTQIQQHVINIIVVAIITGASPTTLWAHQENHP